MILSARLVLAVLSFITLLLFTNVTSGAMSPCSTCFAPLVESTDAGTDSIYLKWRDPLNADPSGYEIEWVVAGSTPTRMPDTLLSGDLDRFTVKGLSSGSAYWFFIRTVCSPGDVSDWNGPYLVSTSLTNPSRCGMNLELEQENCDDPQMLPIVVDDYAGGVLGSTHIIRSISMIIEHTWPEDLTIWLVSPNGREVVLTDKKGRITDHFGDPADPNCENVTILDPFSCQGLEEDSPPYIGRYQPDGDILEFWDGGPVNGTWYIKVCDDLPTDIGTLKYFNIEFEEISCLPVQILGIDSVTDVSASVAWEPVLGSCDSVILEYGESGFLRGAGVSVKTACSPANYKLEGLLPNRTYEVYIYQSCDSLTSDSYCPVTWQTACAPVTLYEGFDDLSPCFDDCGEICRFESVWMNMDDDDMDWTVKRGATTTTRTGPGDDASGNGLYVYLESSGDDCQRGKISELRTTCLEFGGEASGCQFSFQYHMYGRDMGSLSLEISTDGGLSWEVLWETSGDKGDQWIQQFIDLSAYKGMTGNLRFTGETGTGQRSDMALDDLTFFGSVIPAPEGITYYVDVDGDGYGDPDSTIIFCSDMPPAGYTDNGNDCDDSNETINPSAAEVPCNLIDENCNGLDDDRQNNTLEVEIVEIQDATCQGALDGSIEVQGIGGAAPYIFEWSGSFPDTNKLTQIGAGFYKCTVSDIAGCRSESDFIEVKELSVLSYAISSIERPGCSGRKDGTIFFEISGGQTPYHFVWSNGDTTKDLTDIGPGMYQVTVTDNMGCSIESEMINVIPDTSLTLNLLQLENPSCDESDDGLIEIRASGGTPPYSYEWSNGKSGARINALDDGRYVCTITDANGCQVVSRTYSIVSPQVIHIDLNGIDMVSCPGGSDGAIRVQVTGGTPPYFYNWSNGSFQQDIFNVEAGRYMLTVTDINGCNVSSISYEVLEPLTVDFEIDSISHVSCPFSQDGGIGISATGGTGPFTYYWSEGTRDTACINMLDPGTYRVTITDDLGCKYVSDDITIDLLNIPLHVDQRQLDSIKCHGNRTGSIEVNIVDGEAPYRFNWTTGLENEKSVNRDTLGSLAAGTYRVTITDNKGCVGVSKPVSIQQPERLSHILLNREDPTCYGDADGRIGIYITGGTYPYNYSWSNGMMTAIIDSLSAGQYILNITDSFNCSYTTPVFTLTDPELLEMNIQVTGTPANRNEGQINITPKGGKTPYDVIWDQRIQDFNQFEAFKLEAGTYRIILEDSVSCTLDTMVTVPVIQGVLPVSELMDEYALYPVPTDDALHLFMKNSDPLCLQLQVMDITGKIVKNLGSVPCIKEYTNSWQISGILSSGQYFLVIKDKGGLMSILPFQIR